MQNQGEGKGLISQYRELMKKINEEADETKRKDLKKQASKVFDLMLRNAFEDGNIDRFTK